MTKRWFIFVASLDAYLRRVIGMVCFSLSALLLAAALLVCTEMADDMKQAWLEVMLPEA